jgi:hypothetical protein
LLAARGSGAASPVKILKASAEAFEQDTSCPVLSIVSFVARVSRPVFLFSTGRETRAISRPSRSELRGIRPNANQPGGKHSRRRGKTTAAAHELNLLE